MDSSSDEGDFSFFDASEDIAAVNSDSFISLDPFNLPLDATTCVEDRRSKFFSWMMQMGSNENSVDLHRNSESSGAVLRNSCFEDEFKSSRSSISCWSRDSLDLSEEFELRVNDKAVEYVPFSSEQSFRGLALDNNNLLASSSPASSRHKVVMEHSRSEGTMKRAKKKWLGRLKSMTCVINTQDEVDRLKPGYFDGGDSGRRVKVKKYKKQTKQLSALFNGQDIKAHEGSILTMKFSPDGHYIASAGEDGVVRVWRVVEDERSNSPEIDPSCMYFEVDACSKLKPALSNKDEIVKARIMRQTSDSACVIFPPRVFRIVEKPVHEFCGHSGDILDLSWSNNNLLLSASTDKTVRLWRVGCDDCITVFHHSNYVTCVQFNPVDPDCFISGSIDGKVRIWDVSGCQVIDWADIRDIVSAVCYRPDGKGAIVGSLTSNCRFYNISDNHLHLDAQICLHNKKKSLHKRITGFQFFPQDASKVMIVSADSKVRILQGLNVIAKYKGHRNGGIQTSASLAWDGKHIISACEDSNVYVWNCADVGKSTLPKIKKISSHERFSTDASVVTPWSGFNSCQVGVRDALPFTCPTRQEVLLDSSPRRSATWPEERLRSSTTMRKSQYKFLKASCQSTSDSHAWSLVIVTAGWDGRIRSFCNYGLPVPD